MIQKNEKLLKTDLKKHDFYHIAVIRLAEIISNNINSYNERLRLGHIESLTSPIGDVKLGDINDDLVFKQQNKNLMFVILFKCLYDIEPSVTQYVRDKHNNVLYEEIDIYKVVKINGIIKQRYTDLNTIVARQWDKVFSPNQLPYLFKHYDPCDLVKQIHRDVDEEEYSILKIVNSMIKSIEAEEKDD